jgi:hypothetical protein
MQNAVVVMRVLRMPPMGKLVVEVNKNRYEKWADITDENVKRLLLAAIGELIVFADGYENLVEAGFAPPLTKAAEPERDVSELQAEFLASLEAERANLRAKSTTRSSSFMSRATLQPGQTTAKVGPEPLTVVEQIDAILQRYLVANPDLARHNIHLRQDGSGGLRIIVDGQSYQSPREIEDHEIQAVIKRALQEWERS